MSPLVRRTWAVAGQTPILRQRTRSYKHVAGIGAITISPRRRRLGLLFQLHPGETIRQEQTLLFLRELLRHLRGHVVFLWDRLPVHRGRKVQQFIDEHPRLHVEYFPSYAPELNPTEYLWSWLKTNPLANRSAADLDDLTDDVLHASEPVFTNQTLLRGFVAATGLPFQFP
jgi:putative transposase